MQVRQWHLSRNLFLEQYFQLNKFLRSFRTCQVATIALHMSSKASSTPYSIGCCNCKVGNFSLLSLLAHSKCSVHLPGVCQGKRSARSSISYQVRRVPDSLHAGKQRKKLRHRLWKKPAEETSSQRKVGLMNKFNYIVFCRDRKAKRVQGRL